MRPAGKRVTLTVPEVARPLKARLEAQVGAAKNGWDFWFFPKRGKKALAGVLASQDLAESLKKLYANVLETCDVNAGAARVTVAAKGEERGARCATAI